MKINNKYLITLIIPLIYAIFLYIFLPQIMGTKIIEYRVHQYNIIVVILAFIINFLFYLIYDLKNIYYIIGNISVILILMIFYDTFNYIIFGQQQIVLNKVLYISNFSWIIINTVFWGAVGFVFWKITRKIAKSKEKLSIKIVLSLLIIILSHSFTYYLTHPQSFKYNDLWIYGKTKEVIEYKYGKMSSWNSYTVNKDKRKTGFPLIVNRYYIIEFDSNGFATKITMSSVGPGG